MRSPHYFRIVTVLIILAAATMESQIRRLTVEESIALGFENSKSLHASQRRSDYAAWKAQEASTSLYPTVKFQAAYQKLSDVPEFQITLPGKSVAFPVILNTYSLKATLQQPLFTGWKLQSGADIADYTAQASQSDFLKDKTELIFAIKSAYWNVFRAKEIKRLTDESVDQITAHLRDVENLLSQGMATQNDLLKVKVQLANAKVMQSDAETGVRLSMVVFNSTVGLPLESDIAIASALTPATKEFPDVERLLPAAFTKRPDVAGMELRLKSAESGITAAQSGWWPQLYLTADYFYARPNQRIFPAADEFKDTWDVGILLQFDLWNNLTTSYQSSAAQAQRDQTKDALGVLKDGITLEITQAYLNFKQSKQRIALATLTVEQADENYRSTQEKFKAGLTTNSELLDAEVARLQAKLQLTQTMVDYELAEAKLYKAIGE